MPDVLMPRLSDTMAEGILSQWVKHEGDQVRKGDVLAEIETDKAAMEMEAYDEGVLTRILVQEGASVPIGQPDRRHRRHGRGSRRGYRAVATARSRSSRTSSRPSRSTPANRPGAGRPGEGGRPRWPASSPASAASTWPPSAAVAQAAGSSAPTSRKPPASATPPVRCGSRRRHSPGPRLAASRLRHSRAPPQPPPLPLPAPRLP